MKFPDFFVHPFPALALFGLALNDHFLKYTYSGWWTGKLSDFCGLFFFPLFLCALVTTFSTRSLNRRLFISAVVLTDVIFVLIKIWPAATQFYVQTLSGLNFPSKAVTDPTDLIALSVNDPLWRHARRYFGTATEVS